jgi:hypothetical protein
VADAADAGARGRALTAERGACDRLGWLYWVGSKSAAGRMLAWIALQPKHSNRNQNPTSVQPKIGAVFNIAGVILLCVIVPAVAVEHRTAKFVFQGFTKGAAIDVGITNPL